MVNEIKFRILKDVGYINVGIAERCFISMEIRQMLLIN